MTTVLGLQVPVKASETYRDTWSDLYEALFVALGNEASTKTVPQIFSDLVLSRPLLKDYGEVIQTVSSASNAMTIDCTLGNHVNTTLTENTTLTLTNPSPTGNKCVVVWAITQDGSGSHTVTWPASVKWPNNIAPTLTTTINLTDEIVLTTHNAGTTWRGSVRGQGYTA